MIRRSATVIAWHQGIASVKCEKTSACNQCNKKNACGSGLLQRITNHENSYVLRIKSTQPLMVGQKIEIGLSEANLLRAAIVVYMLPLFMAILSASILQLFYTNDLIVFFAALLGGFGGFKLARSYGTYLEASQAEIVQLLDITPSPLSLVDLKDGDSALIRLE